jgi:hypothetical protein
MTKVLKNQLIDTVLIIWTSVNWNLFGACLPAGRQGIWLLEFDPA